ncbi:O-antigen ligase family protein [Candidatus Saccharibacteria bacterium]|nr:O-antigen ligase family protein [Candidatus Saccharibacteria bacterium]
MNNIGKHLKIWLKLDGARLNVWQIAVLLSPIFIWFSYHPVLSFGQGATMNFELSLTLIYVVVLALIGLVQIWQQRRKIIKNRVVWAVGAFVLWSGISLIWTNNFARGVLTFGVLGCLFLVFLAIISAPEKLKKILPSLIKILIISAVIMGILALVQMFVGIWLSRGETLLCAGCVVEQFGFVRPNVFAIEPQFFGSLLITPILLLLYFILTKKTSWKRNFTFIFLSIILVLTLSRGAIFAFGVGALILIILHIREFKKIILSVIFIIASFALALVVQGGAAVINPNFNETFGQTVAKSLNQLSMGIIDFRAKTSPAPTDEKSETEPQYDGYVAESTDVRLKLSKLALETWAQNPSRIIFGVGLGGAGVSMAGQTNDQNAREIVQNEFVEILLERGLVGALLFINLIVGFFIVTRQNKWIWAIITAFLIQWIFFSGLPNALHIYLVLMMFISLRAQSKPAKRS